MAVPSSAPSRALSRFTVLDLTRVRSGPTAVRQLADWGARVIKIETPAHLRRLPEPCRSALVELPAHSFWRWRMTDAPGRNLSGKKIAILATNGFEQSELEIPRDRLRAEYAIRVHKLETQVEQAKLSTARQTIDLSKRDARIGELSVELAALKQSFEENANARRDMIAFGYCAATARIGVSYSPAEPSGRITG